MWRSEPLRRLTDDQVGAVRALLDATLPAEAHRLAVDPQWIDIARHGRRRYAGFLAGDDDDVLDQPNAYAQLTRQGSSWAIELVQSPAIGEAVAVDLLRSALDVVAAEGGGAVHWWVHEPADRHVRVAEAAGLSPGRELRQLRRPLPVGETTDLVVRPFVPGADDEAWVALNNRAFAAHPDQADWTLATLVDRMAEPWFDAAGFLLHPDPASGRLLGFCWTKVHPPVPDDAEGTILGEIYVIGIDPDAGGRGLGRDLVLAGLDHLHRSSAATHAMLYVDADNEGAVRLYDRLGFTLQHTDQAYETTI
jgi:mycothiol synthase